MKKKLVYILFLLCASYLFGQVESYDPNSQGYSEGQTEEPTYEDATITENQKYRESELHGVAVDEQKLKQRADQLDFSEEEIKPKEKKETKPLDLSGNKAPIKWNFWSGDFGKTLAYLLAFAGLAVLLVYLIIAISKKKGQGSNLESGAVAVDGEISRDSLRALNADDALGAALQAGDYRRAARILYLRNLKILMEKGLIKPELQKTNMDYVRELQGNKAQPNLRSLTSLFEFFWYGDMPMDKNLFAAYRIDSDSFYDKVRLGQ